MKIETLLLSLSVFVFLYRKIKKKSAKADDIESTKNVIPPLSPNLGKHIEKDTSLDDEIKLFKQKKMTKKKQKSAVKSLFKKKNIKSSFILSEILNKPSFKE